MLRWWWMKDGVVAAPAVLLKDVVGPPCMCRLCTLLIVFVTISCFLLGFFFFIHLISIRCSRSFLVSLHICLWEYFSWWQGETSLGSQPNGFFIVTVWRAFYVLLRLISRLGLPFLSDEIKFEIRGSISCSCCTFSLWRCYIMFDENDRQATFQGSQVESSSVPFVFFHFNSPLRENWQVSICHLN